MLNPLRILNTATDRIELARPSFSTAGSPTPTVRAYIGLNGYIVVNGGTVNNALTGPINVATGGAVFSGLTGNTSYRIIVVAENAGGCFCTGDHPIDRLPYAGTESPGDIESHVDFDHARKADLRGERQSGSGRIRLDWRRRSDSQPGRSCARRAWLFYRRDEQQSYIFRTGSNRYVSCDRFCVRRPG